MPYQLPPPRYDSTISLEEAIFMRSSIRNYDISQALSTQDISQVLWAANGYTHGNVPGTTMSRFKGVPSAGACYPWSVYVLIQNVIGLSPGLWAYHPREHQVGFISNPNINSIVEACHNQKFIKDAPAIFFITAEYHKTYQRYGSQRGERYVHLDVGHVGQNIYLQTTALDLYTCEIAAFIDSELKVQLGLRHTAEDPVLVFPVGK
jgi:SagB-type dehydrogenase family enzyme